MSKKLFFLPALLLVSAALYFSSCGDDCKVKIEDFVGQFVVTEDCSNSQPSSYTVTITKGATDTEVKISNFWSLFGAAVTANVDCDFIDIPRQEPDNDKYFVEGSGTLSQEDDIIVINITYKVTDETDPANITTDNCTSTQYIKI
jgi:hypothetical protein